MLFLIRLKQMDMYVYYRVPVTSGLLLQSRVTAMQTALSAKYGIAVALKRRPDEKDGCHTWMEVYLDVPDGFAAILDSGAASLVKLIDGERHVECFLEIASISCLVNASARI
jgi:Domain of unknown function (DUF4936)